MMASDVKLNKGQIELWALTKIAMLFFIIALALVALGISENEKTALCGEQARATVRVIASNINQVLTSPAEDARVVYKLDPSIAVSKNKFGERYTVWIAKREPAAGNTVQLRIVVKPSTDPRCTQSEALFYDKTKVETVFRASGADVALRDDLSAGEEVFEMLPSTPQLSVRSRFLVIVKCSDPVNPLGIKQVYFDNCMNDNAEACSQFELTCGA